MYAPLVRQKNTLSVCPARQTPCTHDDDHIVIYVYFVRDGDYDDEDGIIIKIFFMKNKATAAAFNESNAPVYNARGTRYSVRKKEKLTVRRC